jgi:hypothetical protein
MLPTYDDRIRLSFMLAEAAQVHQGKGFAFGAGLMAMVATQPNATAQVAVCGTIIIPFGELNKQHTIEIELIDWDGRSFLVTTPMGEQPFKINAGFRGALPPMLPRGSEVVAPFAVQFALPLRVGRYRFRIKLDSVEVPEASLPFYVLDPKDVGMAPGAQPQA